MSSITELLEHLIRVADEKKATQIVAYDVAGKSSITDYILVLGTSNKVHCQALSREMDQAAGQFIGDHKSTDFYKPRLSGDSESEWIVLDLNSIVIHILTEHMREYYKIDTLLEKRAVVYHY